MRGYGQFCPVAKASEVFAERWTPLVLRELLCGSTTFNDLQRGVPLMSRSLLSKRLRDLEQAGIVERRTAPGRAHATYHVTEAGQELRPIIVALGEWGQRWARSDLGRDDLDPTLLMWDVHRRIDVHALPDRRVVVQFDFTDMPKNGVRRTWLVLDRPSVDVCYKDPGFEIDLVVTASLHALTAVWIGSRELSEALRDGSIDVAGRRELRTALPRWLQLSVFAGVGRAP